MRWFRERCQFVTGAVLLALALQLAVTFGHVHASHLSGASATIADSLNKADQPRRPDTDGCGACAILALLSGAQIAGAPVLAIALASVPADRIPAPEAVLAEAPGIAFQARGPPQA
jgi:hypothetical protein